LLTRLPRIASKLIYDARHEFKRRVENFYGGGFAEIFKGLPSFNPTSGGKDGTLAILTLRAAQNTFPLLVKLLEQSGREPLAPIAADEFCDNAASRENAATLGKLFTIYGSDKTSHQYHLIYGKIMIGVKDLLEIGLGTNNTKFVSTMGVDGKPGASLRAFRDFLPEASIYGADIDRGALFNEDRIETFYLDQTDFAAYRGLPVKTYDIIIDDGLHTVDANLTVLIYAMEALRPGAWLVIEDIHPAAEPIWRVLPALLPPSYESHLIKTDSLVFVMRRPPIHVT
jgi:hypothetical protein